MTRQLECLECGTAFTPRVRGAEFCTTPCRKSFHARRVARGALMYDLYMATRFDRAQAEIDKSWTLLARMAAAFREEDRRDRAGRRSWMRAKAIVERFPWLRSTLSKVGFGRAS